jgi:hypothetical protein
MRNKAPEIRIFTIRDQKVVLDSDLASVYRVPTKVLNQAFRRARSRFPSDFAFQLSADEYDFMRSQLVTASSAERTIVTGCDRISPEHPPSSVGFHRTRRATGRQYSA